MRASFSRIASTLGLRTFQFVTSLSEPNSDQRHDCHLCRERLVLKDGTLLTSIAIIDSQIGSAGNQTTDCTYNACDNNALGSWLY
jgi:hypothetical protein